MKKTQAIKKVLVFGTFDMLHPGHVHFLKKAKRLGKLYVSVSSDKNVLLLKQVKPKNSEQIRYKKIKDLGIADKVIIGEKKINNWGDLKKIKPDIVAVGYDQKKLETSLKHLVLKHQFIIKRMTGYKSKIYKSKILRKKCLI